MIIVGKTVGIWADLFRRSCESSSFAFIGIVVRTRAAVLRRVSFGAVAKAWVENRTLDIIIWVRVHAISRFGGRADLEGPWAPSPEVTVGDVLNVGHRVRAVDSGVCKETCRCDAGGIGEVWWNLLEFGGVTRYVGNSHGEVVTVHKRDVVVSVFTI